MNDDGTMARMPDLVAFAQRHGIKLGTIADLIHHRRRTERLVKRAEEGVLQSAVGGEWRVVVFQTALDPGEHAALVKGDLSGPGPVLVRMHAANMLEAAAGRNMPELYGAMRMIAAEGRGVVVLLRDWRPTGLSEQVRRIRERRKLEGEIRDYGIGAQILADLGVHELIRLSNNPRPVVGLEGYELRVVETRPIPLPAEEVPS
jgi:3,4-dihydroxy 2-butanone 4-phosphate synthase/GTP cyclohydrolase II